MDKSIKLIITLMLLIGLVGCSKGAKSPEELGEAHFELYFDVLLGEDVDVDNQCIEIYSDDFVDYCKNSMSETAELEGYQDLTKDDYELYSVTSETMDDERQELIGFEEYDVVYEVTISYGMTITIGNEDTLIEDSYSLFVVKVDGEFKAVVPGYLNN